MRFGDLVVLLLEGIAKIGWPRLRLRLARLAARILPEIPMLSGPWVVSFYDPDPSDARPITVDATLRQFGRHVYGVGHIQGQHGDGFSFNGVIRRNVFYGSFARLNEHVLAGTGTFVLKILARSDKLVGSCIWYDGQLDRAWSSPYLWER